MESLKKDLLNFCKGFGIWVVLLILNTRSGEAGVNSIKIILDIVLAVILVGNYKIGKYIALLVAALTTLITLFPIPSGLETILLIGIAILGGILLKSVSKEYPPEGDPDKENTDSEEPQGNYTYGSSTNTQQTQNNTNFFKFFKTGSKNKAKNNCGTDWSSKNFLNPYEKYSYSPESGIRISKENFPKAYITIPTNNIILYIHQEGWQTWLGLCNVSFKTAFNGQAYGEQELQNIRLKSAKELETILNRNVNTL